VTFKHRYSFEAGNWDGGVVEVSNDGGATWNLTPGGYPGFTNAGTSAPIGAGRPAFVGRNAGWPNFITTTLNLGTYANQTIQIRFRVGADESTGAPGWDVDDITVNGLTNTPFTAIAPDACGTP
jgi:hypothetical protein